jgi:cobalt/nickel transport system permease protein
MDIARIDYWAASGTSTLHRSALVSKVLATASVIACVVLSRDIFFLVSLYAFVVISVRLARLPVLQIVGISLFPALFSVLYAISLARTGWALPAVVVMKAVTAASAMILLVSTTPHAEVIGLFGRALPKVVKDGLFMTYRSFFILIELVGNFLSALRLRGGFRPGRILRNAGNISSGLGMMFILAYEKSQMLYDVMSVRGYSGKLTGKTPLGGVGFRDLPFLAVAAAFLGIAVYSKSTGNQAPRAILPALLISYLACMEAMRFWKR